MGCVYSNHNKRSKKKPTGNGDVQLSNGDSMIRRNSSTNQTNNRRRIFEACSVKEKQNGHIEITDNELIFHFGEGKRVDWPLKYLRGYGCLNDLFSFECGRKCSTGSGIYIFDCPQAELLLETLINQIAVMANSNNNNQTNQQLPHSQQVNDNGPSLHEYQNTNSERDMIQRPGSQLETQNSTRSSSNTGVHTYLNSTVISGQLKSQPNYYTSNPLSHNCSPLTRRMTGSKHSLDETGSNSSTHNYRWCLSENHSGSGVNNGGGFDYRTLPSMRSESSFSSHAYVNAFNNFNNNNSNDQNNEKYRIRRSSDSNHDHYQNRHPHFGVNKINARKLEQIKSKIDESDYLGTFCYVNFDQNVIKNKSSLTEFKNRSNNSRVSTPESYVQLDLNNKIKTQNDNLETNVMNHLSANTLENGENKNHGELLLPSTTRKLSRNMNCSTTTITATTKANDKFTSNSVINSDNENKERIQNNNNKTSNASTTTTTVPYAQIDFAKTMALSNSTANHRKL